MPLLFTCARPQVKNWYVVLNGQLKLLCDSDEDKTYYVGDWEVRLCITKYNITTNGNSYHRRACTKLLVTVVHYGILAQV